MVTKPIPLFLVILRRQVGLRVGSPVKTRTYLFLPPDKDGAKSCLSCARDAP